MKYRLHKYRLKPIPRHYNKDIDDKLDNEICQFKDHLRFITSQECLEILELVCEIDSMEAIYNCETLSKV